MAGPQALIRALSHLHSPTELHGLVLPIELAQDGATVAAERRDIWRRTATCHCQARRHALPRTDDGLHLK